VVAQTDGTMFLGNSPTVLMTPTENCKESRQRMFHHHHHQQQQQQQQQYTDVIGETPVCDGQQSIEVRDFEYLICRFSV
jgi:hypothetical protein